MAKFKTVLITLMIVCLSGFALYGAEVQSMSVQVRKSQMRSSPSYLGKIVASLAYGDRVDVMEQKGAWAQVQKQGGKKKGWMNQSALSPKKIVLNASDADIAQAASSDEVALAGKGFNKEVEKNFRAMNPNVNFKDVDKMEKKVISQKKIRIFLKKGKLSPPGGAQ